MCACVVRLLSTSKMSMRSRKFQQSLYVSSTIHMSATITGTAGVAQEHGPNDYFLSVESAPTYILTS